MIEFKHSGTNPNRLPLGSPSSLTESLEKSRIFKFPASSTNHLGSMYFFTYELYTVWLFRNRTKITILSMKSFKKFCILISRVRAHTHTHAYTPTHVRSHDARA